MFFDVTIWGSVADWFTGCVTGLTAYLLWRTLKSQTKVQEAQNQLIRIEQLRHSREIQPRFTLEQPNLTIRESGGISKIQMSFFRLRLNNNVAQNVAIIIEQPYVWIFR